MTPFSPEITFETPGDLSVVYNVVNSSYVEDSNTGLVFCNVFIGFTPTFTNASGKLKITNFPQAAVGGSFSLPISLAQCFNFPPHTSMLCATVDAGNDFATVVASGSIYAAANLTASELVSGGNYFLSFSGHYAY